MEYKANGKLLLSGEYLVLQGAAALAMPVRFGQHMKVSCSGEPGLSWTSHDPRGEWFRCRFSLPRLDILSTTHEDTAASLQRLLFSAAALHPEHLGTAGGCHVTVTADYPPEWGLGSSSTLISLVSQWFNVDDLSLYRMVASGSGYDLACARRDHPFLFTLDDGVPEIQPVSPGKALQENTWFTWLGKKQDSDAEVSAFRSSAMADRDEVDAVSRISSAMAVAATPFELISLADEHEKILSRILGRPVLKSHFPGIPGTIKSLGAWGGDFAMIVSPGNEETVKQYLAAQGLKVVFSYRQLQLSHG